MSSATLAPPAHPAKFPAVILERLRAVLELEERPGPGPFRVLDPFAGIGGVHELAGPGVETVGVELEPEWAGQHAGTIVGDATALPFPSSSFDAVVTSPAYGNRMADGYDGRDGSRRHTYRLYLGRELTAGSGAGMQWGDAYRELHRSAWAEAWRVLQPGGLLVVNIKNHVRAGRVVPVVEWHLAELLELGCHLEAVERIETGGIRDGSNHAARVPAEHLLIVRRPEVTA